MKSSLYFTAVTAIAAVLGCSLITSDAGRAQSAAQVQGTSATYELLKPQGAGPFAAVVVMHSCDGVNENTRRWADRLVGWGYAALIVDSFRPRGLSGVCGNPGSFPAPVRANDAIAAKNYLMSLPNIAKGRIGLIGFSHGAGAALAAATREDAAFRAVVAFYPWCTNRQPDNALILIGDADDWTPSSRCRGAPNLKVYPGATHAFDSQRPDRLYHGHHLSYDAAAATDAIDRTRRFLSSHLDR
jgi:dienelactone hydrolase